jgi:predicted ATP-grasp superfamily ATP-dependent carboligase
LDALILRTSPNSLSAARSLGRAGIRVTIAAMAIDPAVRSSRYVTGVLPLTAIDDSAVDKLLAAASGGDNKPFLLATGDEDALLVARHQQRLAERYCFVSPTHDALDGIVDKARLYETARRHGIPHPKFHVVRAAGDIEAAIEAVDTPCYVKPAMAHEWRRYRRGKLERARNAIELRQILRDFIALRLVAIPIEIIPGTDGDVHSVTAYIDKTGRPVAWRTKRKIRQFPVDAGDGCAQEITDQPAVAELGLKLLAACDHRGPATVEFRRDARDGRFVLMEINARTILGQEMITRSGLDAALLALHDATGRPFPPPTPASRVQWVFLGPDFRAFRELRRRGSITTLAWLKSVAGSRSFAYFAWDDPAPFLARIGLWIGRHLRGRFRRAPAANP